MKRPVLLSLSCLLASCSFSFGRFIELPEDVRDLEASTYIVAKHNAERNMPTRFTLSALERRGTEENRNPLFGKIIYKGSYVEDKLTLGHDSEAFFSRISSRSVEGGKGTGSDVYCYIADKRIVMDTISYDVVDGKDVNKRPSREQSDEYSSVEAARAGYNNWVYDYVKSLYDQWQTIFDDNFDSIPSTYAKGNKKTMEYKCYKRENFEKDFKITLSIFKDEKKDSGLTYISAAAADYMISDYRSVKRGSSNSVTEIEMNLSGEVNIIRPIIRG